MTMLKTATCAALLALTMAASTAHAQTASQDQADQLLNTTAAPPGTINAVNDGETYHRADDAEQDPAELRTTQALNDEIASRNALAENQERVDQMAFDAERAAHEQVVAQAMQAQLAYEADLRRVDAERRQWEADRARWEADVRACQAGDRTRCAAPRY